MANELADELNLPRRRPSARQVVIFQTCFMVNRSAEEGPTDDILPGDLEPAFHSVPLVSVWRWLESDNEYPAKSACDGADADLGAFSLGNRPRDVMFGRLDEAEVSGL